MSRNLKPGDRMAVLVPHTFSAESCGDDGFGEVMGIFDNTGDYNSFPEHWDYVIDYEHVKNKISSGDLIIVEYVGADIVVDTKWHYWKLVEED